MNLDPLFAPEHIVIVGASSDSGRVGGRPIAYLQRLGYTGRISPVNPKREQIAGLQCYPSPLQVPGEPDLALIAVPGRAAVAAVEQCGERGIPSAIIFTAGFAEVGGGGAELEAELLQVARRYEMRVCGPNTLGIISGPLRAAASFGTCLDRTETLEPGNVGLISQSGALGAFMHRECQLLGVPLRHFVATGNEMDINAGDYLQYMAEDEGTRAVGLYLEGIRDGGSLIAGLERARELAKPVCVMKVGRGERAREAAQSHTGAMTGEDAVVDATLRQFGAVRMDSVDDLLAFLYLASSLREWPKGGRLGIVTMSGGVGVWSADVAEEAGVTLPDLTQETEVKLGEVLPDFASVTNPVDVTGQIVNEPSLLAESVAIVASDPNVDAVLVGLGLQETIGEEIAERVTETARATTKPVVTAWMAGPAEAYALLEAANVPIFRSLGTGLRAITNFAAWAKAQHAWRDWPGEPPRYESAVEAGIIKGNPTEHEAKELLASVGINAPRGGLVHSGQAAAACISKLGGAAVMKAQLPGLAHKTEMGLVQLGIESPEQAHDSFQHMQQSAKAAGLLTDEEALPCLVEEMVDEAVELILGYRIDDVFGPLVLLGLGGTNTELFRWFATRVAPLRPQDVEGLLEESKAGTVLTGFRGRSVDDLSLLTDAVLRFADFVSANQHQLAEVEINPLGVLRGSGRVVALDALIVPKPEHADTERHTKEV